LFSMKIVAFGSTGHGVNAKDSSMKANFNYNHK
jgi:hypothetical protein